MSRYAIIGFGCAGYYAARALRQYCPDSQIDIYSDTGEAPANPMLTTYYIAGKISREGQFPMGSREEIIRELQIRLLEDSPVKKVHARERIVEREDGSRQSYDDIVIATGASPLVPPIPGRPEKGVYVMRTTADADLFLEKLRQGVGSALVIGASWVGIKIIEDLRSYHVERIILADMAPRIFPTATLPQTAEAIHAYLEDLGVELLFGRGISAMREEPDGIVSVFSDGSEVKTDIVALCLGMRSNVGILDRDEVEIGRGVRVNSRMETSAPHIYAAGDCCEAEELITGQYMAVNLWANARMQGRVAGMNIAGIREEYQGNFLHNITHFIDMDFIGLGNNRAEGESVTYVSPDGWRLEMIVQEDRPVCINILDNRSLSGPAKSILLRKIENPAEKLSVDAVVALKTAGLPMEIIQTIEGGSHGNA